MSPKNTLAHFEIFILQMNFRYYTSASKEIKPICVIFLPVRDPFPIELLTVPPLGGEAEEARAYEGHYSGKNELARGAGPELSTEYGCPHISFYR